MKKILLILRKKNVTNTNRQHNNWVNDCKNVYNIDYWGEGFGNTSLQSLKNKIDFFKPDYIYLTIRKRYFNLNNDKFKNGCTNLEQLYSQTWLPDLTSIKIPKIFVEVDTCYYNVNDKWYKQFDKVYCRCPWWNNWNNVPLFRWSVPEKAFPIKEEKRKNIRFIGHWNSKIIANNKIVNNAYKIRQKIKELYPQVSFSIFKNDKYWEYLHKSSALVCPTEHIYGNYIPAKLFEYLASGAAILTNCDLKQAGIPELEPYVIRYTDITDLKEKLKIDFTPYYGKAKEVMKNHTHKIRYKELFGE